MKDMSIDTLEEEQVALQIVERLSKLGKPFTVSSSYLGCPNKNPTEFIKALALSFEKKYLTTENSKNLVDQIAQAWSDAVEAEPALANENIAPHAFLGAIHRQPDLWNAELKIGNAPQTSP